MRFSDLLTRSLRHYWRTNLAVVLGVATAVTVLGGALLVGDSVRGSLRDIALQRIGSTDFIVASPEFFTDRLAALRTDPDFEKDFAAAAGLVVLPGLATNQETGRRAGRVIVYGVAPDFWEFHGRPPATPDEALGDRDVFLSEPLAREIGAAAGSAVLLRIQRPADIPLESLHGRKDDVGRTVRLTVRKVLSASELGEFSLQPQQGDVRAAFVSRGRLDADSIASPGQLNTLLVSSRSGTDTDRRARLEALVRRHAGAADVGLTLRTLSSQSDASLPALSIEAPGTLIDERRESAVLETARELSLPATPVLTYLVNGMRAGDRTTPYSLVTAIELTTLVPDLVANDSRLPPIVLNEWAARDLAVKPGDRVTLDYYIWEDPGRLTTKSSTFELAAVVPISGLAADRTFAPHYPGITDSDNLRDWDPPFPIDLRRIRDVDEDYWERYRTTPKAFVPEAFGRAFWGSRYGQATSIRIAAGPGVEQFGERLRGKIDPIAFGIGVRDIRAETLAASRGATNFGEYFTYFSFFLVVSAVMLAALFFKLGVEQRIREIGLLRAVGFSTAAVRRLFLAEGFLLAAAGSVIGLVGAVGYAQLLMTGLRTWWLDAVGTTALVLHVAPLSLAAGALGGIVAAVVCIWWTLRGLSRVTERALLAGDLGEDAQLGIGNLELGMRAGTWTRILNSKFLILNFASVSLLLLFLASVGA